VGVIVIVGAMLTLALTAMWLLVAGLTIEGS